MNTPDKNQRLEFLSGDNALSAYLHDIRKMKSLTKSEELALVTRIQAGDKRAMKSLVEANLKFVVAVCRNYQHQGMPMVDLISEGNLGLIRAARRFDGNLNFKFISYAVWWIRQGILTALAEQSRVLNISTGKINVMHRIGKTTQKLSQTLGRQPSMSEVAAEVGISESEVDKCLDLAKPHLSLSRPVIGEENGNLEDCLPDPNAMRPDGPVREWMAARKMESMLKPLPEREGDVIRLFYGIGNPIALTYQEIGERYDLTHERIRQIKESGLNRLRHPSKAKQFCALRKELIPS